jgi:replicative DNA helicase
MAFPERTRDGGASGGPKTPQGPPWSPEAEAGVLGAMLRANRCIDDVASALRAEDFYTDANQKLFRAILECGRGGRPVDAVLLADELKRRGWVEDVGGYQAIVPLWDAAPTAGNVMHHAGVVRDHALLRGLLLAAQETIDDVTRPAMGAEQAVEEAARRIARLASGRAAADPVALDDVLHEAFAAIDARLAARRAPGRPSGVPGLDQMTGGFRGGELTLVGARPSRGKTAVSLTFAKAAAGDGEPVLFCSCEQARVELGERLLAGEARLDLQNVRSHRMSDSIKELLREAGNAMGGLQLYIDDARRQSARHVARQARRLKARRGLAMVVVDYVGLMAAEGRRDQKRYEVVGDLARDLRDLAGELAVPVILLAQLNRGAEERGKDSRPMLSDLRESGDLEQHADCVILLHVPRDRKDDDVWPLELMLEKQRNGPTGTVLTRFIKAQMRFDDAPLSSPFAGKGVPRG